MIVQVKNKRQSIKDAASLNVQNLNSRQAGARAGNASSKTRKALRGSSQP